MSPRAAWRLEADVLDSAPGRAGDGADVLRPSPPGFVGGSAERDPAEPDKLQLPFGELSHLIGFVEPLQHDVDHGLASRHVGVNLSQAGEGSGQPDAADLTDSSMSWWSGPGYCGVGVKVLVIQGCQSPLWSRSHQLTVMVPSGLALIFPSSPSRYWKRAGPSNVSASPSTLPS
jgi:hypothetical protein